ncbi:MAG: lamin tail domain-containing protein [Bacteroidales bacterium]|nr:lamin tail domain-containing protein [Bacteroidales bacterium]
MVARMMDVENPCSGKENWLASSDTRGGTPGTKNSVSKAVTDTRIFDWDKLDLPNDSTVRIYFTKSFNPHTLTTGLFEVDNGKGAPTSITVDQLQYRYIDLIFSKPFSALTQYHLEVSATIESCSGQSIGKELNFTFRLPEPLTAGDIIINEIMFDPAGEAPEYVELYNNSEKYIRSHDLKLSYRTADGKYENWFQPESGSFLISPGYFLVLTKYKDSFGEYYPVPDLRCVIASVSFPVLSDEAGCFATMDKSLQTMDEFCYTKKYHFPLLADPSGVSLERIRYNEPAADPTNWHSASSTSGFATPGERNSQYLESKDTGNEITLEYEIFSPDNDGYKDMATLHYNLDQPGYVATIIVF